jgi:protein-S-isoprenylcysteine O-methyltransferase Ste14
VVWAAGYIREAFMGDVKPVLDKIVKKGPYRLVRHPVYLGMTIALSGIPITLKSWPGILSVFIFFLPSVIYRARLEEKALAQKFGKEWQEYVKTTNFAIPFVRSKHK